MSWPSALFKPLMSPIALAITSLTVSYSASWYQVGHPAYIGGPACIRSFMVILYRVFSFCFVLCAKKRLKQSIAVRGSR